MKPIPLSLTSAIAPTIMLALLGSPNAHAVDYTWTQTADGSQDWTVGGNWSTGQFVSDPGNALVFFDTTQITTNASQTITNIPSTLSMNTLTLGGKGPNGAKVAYVVIGDNTSTWTIGDGTTSTINLTSIKGGGHAGTDDIRYTVAPNLTLNQALTTFTGNGISYGDGYNFTGNITETAAGYGITKSGTSTLTLSGTNTYTGTTTVTGGTLRLNSATALSGGTEVTGGTSALTINGGVVELGSSDFQRNLGTGSDQFQITGGTSGFSAFGGARNITVNNDAATELVWGSASFTPGTLLLNASAADSALTLSNNIDLNASTRTVKVDANTAILSGDIRTNSGTAGLTKTGSGTLVLSGANTYNGATTISGGTLRVGAANNLGDASAGLVFNGGTLQITGTSLTNISGIGHTVTFTAGSKDVGFDIFDAANTFTADQTIQGRKLIKSGAGTLVLNQTHAFTDTTTVSGGGTLVLDYSTGDTSRLVDGKALILGGGTLTLSGGTHSEVVSSTTLSDFTSNSITRSSGTATINLNAIARGSNASSVLALSEAGIATTDTTNNTTIGATGTTGILGAWATVGSHWAVNSTNGADGSIIAYSDYVALGTSGGSGSTNYELKGGSTLTGNISANTLRIEGTADNQVLNIGSSNITMTAFKNNKGGILYAGGANNNYTITGTGKIQPANGNGQSLLINTYTGTLTIDAELNWGSSDFVKAGEGTLVLNHASNDYTGKTSILAGALAVNGVLSSGATTVNSGATLQGSGTIVGSVTVLSGGTIAAGNSIESLATGALSLEGGSTFAYEMDNDAAAGIAGDLTAVTGDLTIESLAMLNLFELGAGSWDLGEKLTLVSYTGTWNNGTFTYEGETLADDSTFNLDGTEWQFDYNDTAAGSNYTGDLTGATFVTMTAAVPEPSTFALLGLGGLALILRRRR